MLRYPNKILLSLTLCALTQSAFAEVGSPGFGFFDKKAEGWFFYNEEEPEEEIEIEEIEPQIAAEPEAKPPEKEPEPVLAIPNAPSVLSASWFRENLPKYKDAAWDNPTVENLRTYLYLQRYAMDRSEQFSSASEMAVVGDPFLDEEARRPSATYASQKLDRWAGNESDKLIAKIAKKAGIFFFFKSESNASQIQAPIVSALKFRENFTVLPVSVDGKPLPDGSFPDFRVDDGQAEKLGVVDYPSLFLVSGEREVEPISQGILSLAEIKHRIILVANRRGWITAEEFNKTKPIMNLDRNLAAILDQDSKELSSIAAQSGDAESNFIPPEKLSEFIQKKFLQDR